MGWNSSSVEYAQDKEVNIEWQPHVCNKYHAQYVSIRKYIQIILEKDIDELKYNYNIERRVFMILSIMPYLSTFLTEKHETFHHITELSQKRLRYTTKRI